MRDNYILTAESVTEGHPDKLCDAIADSVLASLLQIQRQILQYDFLSISGGYIKCPVNEFPHILFLYYKNSL